MIDIILILNSKLWVLVLKEQEGHFLFTESWNQNVWCWKGLIRIIESNFLFLARLPKTKLYD